MAQASRARVSTPHVFETFSLKPVSIIDFSGSPENVGLIEEFFVRKNSNRPSELIRYVPSLAAAIAVCEIEELDARLRAVYVGLMPAASEAIHSSKNGPQYRVPAMVYEEVVNAIFDTVHKAQYKRKKQFVSIAFNREADRVADPGLRFLTAARSNEIIDYAVEQLDAAMGKMFISKVFPPKSEIFRRQQQYECAPPRQLSRRSVREGMTFREKLIAAMHD